MREIATELRRFVEAGDRVALATVVDTRRSAPRPVGAKLLISSGGELAGSVSGGCVENEVYGVGREVLDGAAPRRLTYGIEDDVAFGVGLPCGGEIDVWVEAADPALLERAIRAEEAGEHGVRYVVLDGPQVGANLLTLEGGERLGDGPAALEGLTHELVRSGRSKLLDVDGTTVFADLVGPPPRVLVVGAVDTAEALCRLASDLGWRTVVADPRGKFATRERIPSAERLLVAWPEEALAEAEVDHATAVVVLTHEERFDVPALAGALATEAFYVGALGSRRAQEARRERLLEAGVDEEAIDRIAGPSGLDIGASTPAETALSILGEIVAARAGRPGGRLKEAGGRIHADVA
ncbi:MAG TPA: XdhC family protein [Gaiellaceae bacterium]|nr:XdhC family protein [Gaiellaceae bacterium]